MAHPFTDGELEAFLDESLPPGKMTQIEEALRADESLTQALAAIVGRRDAGVHSLGAIWRRHRLTCPSREQLGSFLLGVLEQQQNDYVRFHLETVGCRFCDASIADLRAQQAAAHAEGASQRRRRYFQTSEGLLHGGQD